LYSTATSQQRHIALSSIIIIVIWIFGVA